MDQAFLDMMPFSVTLEPVASIDRYGKKTYGAAIAAPGRVSYGQVMTTSSGGQNVVARGKVTLGGVFGVTAEYRLTLPDGSQPPILNVERIADESEWHHEVIFFA